MGSGIAQVVAASGRRVSLHDAVPGAVERGVEGMRRSLAKLAEKGGPDPADVLARVTQVDGIVPADLLIEAVVEDAGVKEQVFRAADETLPPESILASNTSSIPITSLAAVTSRPDRVIGMHFFNPVPLLKLVEVIRAVQTSDETAADIVAAPGAGHRADPQPAQAPPGQLRARAQPGARVPRRDAAGGGADPRRPRALLPLHHRRGRPPRGVGLVPGAGAPPADVPGRRRRRRRGRARQGPRVPQGAAASLARPGHRRRGGGLGRQRHGPDVVDVRHHRGVVRAAPGGPRGAGPPHARRRGADRRPPGRRLGRGGRGAAPARRTTPAPARPRADAVGGPARARPAGQLALVGSPYPSIADLVQDLRAAIVGDLVDARPAVRDAGVVRRAAGRGAS